MGNNALTILVVEDDVIIRLNTAARLRKWGYKVMEAANGQAGLEIVKIAHQLALIVTDLNMPEMDGVTMTEEIRRIPGKNDLPIILYSSGLWRSTMDLARSAGINEIVSKDARPEVLLTAVKKCLAKAEKKKGKK